MKFDYYVIRLYTIELETNVDFDYHTINSIRN